MVGRFGSREICDVTFKALTNNQKIGNEEFMAGQPVFIIDTATASNMEQASNTVYAQGGQGYNRLIAWEGEKTMTFTVTDALMSPLGLAVLTGAGFAKEGEDKHVHVTYDAAVENGTAKIPFGALCNELGLSSTTTQLKICGDEIVKPYASKLDNNGAVVGWYKGITFEAEADEKGIITLTGEDLVFKNVGSLTETGTAKFDFYVVLNTEATEIKIGPNDFGGYFYVEADTLYRNQDGKDMAATITFPKVKIQSGFTIAMAANGDPSTFDFVMDAFPAYTYFDHEKKVVCDITIVSGEKSNSDDALHTPHGNTASAEDILTSTRETVKAVFDEEYSEWIAKEGNTDNGNVKKTKYENKIAAAKTVAELLAIQKEIMTEFKVI